MADTKISALTAAGAAAGANELPINEAGTSKKVTATQLGTLINTSPALTGTPTAPTAAIDTNTTQVASTAFVQTGGPVKVKSIATDATANATTTGVEITGINMLCGVGTYVFQYFIRYITSVTTTGVAFGVNHTGTATVFAANMRWQESTTAASTGAASQAVTGAGGRIVGGSSTRTASTTVPNLGPTISADTTGDMLAVIEGYIIVTASGDLELWHASETAASTTVKAGTSLMLTKVG